MKRKLKLWLGGLAVVLALVVFVAPVGVGFMAEGRYTHLLERLAADQPGLEIEVVEYERGWFVSRSEVELEIVDPTLAEVLVDGGWARESDGRALIDLRERLHHGPVPFTANAPWGQRWRPGFAVLESRLEESMPAVTELDLDVENTAHLGLLGGFHGIFRVAAFDLEEDGLQVASEEDIRVDYRFNRNLDRMDVTGRSGEVRVLSSAGEGIVLDGLWLGMNQRRGPADLWLGGTELRIAGGETRTPDQEPMEFGRILVTSDLERGDGDLLDQKQELELEHLRQDEWEAGPAVLQTTLFNLEPEAFAELQEAATRMDPEALGPAFLGNGDLAELGDPLAALARHRPGVRVDQFNVQLPEGEVDGEGELRVVDEEADVIDSMIEEQDWLGLVAGSGRMAVGEEILQRAVATMLMGHDPTVSLEDDMVQLINTQLDAAVEEGMLERTETGYELRAVYEDRTLSINDNPVARW